MGGRRFARAVVRTHNNRLQRTVMRYRRRAASASFHCAHTARVMRWRAAAQLHGMRTSSLTISKRDLQRLRLRALRAQRKDQSEVCGVLVQRGQRLPLMFLPKLSQRRGSFEMSRADISAHRARARSRGGRVVGAFHSHPVSEAVPSSRDIAESPVNSLMLIYDVCGRDVKLWRVVKCKGTKVVRGRAVARGA
jgi:proteasome lid subunit RPN8/RPN11